MFFHLSSQDSTTSSRDIHAKNVEVTSECRNLMSLVSCTPDSDRLLVPKGTSRHL